jgi:beta-phosphoglucomutase-like phosphatase (HAD superfamily)
MLLNDAAITTVLFDVDGTLIDSVDAHAQAWTEALRTWGHDVSVEAVRRQIGKGGDQLLPVFLTQAAAPWRYEAHYRLCSSASARASRWTASASKSRTCSVRRSR